MTEKEINIVIAEACGWIWHGDASWTKDPNNFYWKKDLNYRTLPDYLNDLNAMHDAERLLDDDQWLEYMLNLQDVLQRDPYRGKWIVCQDNMHSTAAQRAKAFVITIGKYKDKL